MQTACSWYMHTTASGITQMCVLMSANACHITVDCKRDASSVSSTCQSRNIQHTADSVLLHLFCSAHVPKFVWVLRLVAWTAYLYLLPALLVIRSINTERAVAQTLAQKTSFVAETCQELYAPKHRQQE